MEGSQDGRARAPLVWRCQPHLAQVERHAVLDLLSRLERTLGREPIDATFRRSIAQGGAGNHWLAWDGDALSGYAYATPDDVPTVEMAAGGYDADLCAGLLAQAPAVTWWTRGEVALPTACEVLRTLAYMTVPLPVEVTALPAGVSRRAFVPGRDEASWLTLNNLAFAEHPEQGAWRLDDLLEREREPWFDPSGLLLFECDGALAASIWMRAHARPDGRIGEVMVVAVHPASRGRRLGEVAVTHGLEEMRREGATTGALYVDERNGPAMALYRRLGFTVARRDRLVRFTR